MLCDWKGELIEPCDSCEQLKGFASAISLATEMKKELARLRAEVSRLNEQIRRDDENDKPYIRRLEDQVRALKNLAPYKLKPGQVVAEWVPCPCCAPPEKHCAFCMGVNKILVEEGK
jgi:hypothetical protein